MTVYPRKEEDPYVEKFGDFDAVGGASCLCEDCCRYRSKYDLEGKHLDEEEEYVPTMGQGGKG
jgi:hypothetical protein